MKKVGVIGASFNPPTLGHKSVVMQALKTFDQVILVPSLKHPFNKSLAPFLHRFAMLRIFKELLPKQFSNDVLFINVEGMLLADRQRKYVYTFDVLEKLEKYYQIIGEPVKLRFIMGPDNANKKVWHKFHRYQEIEQRWSPFIVKEDIQVHSSHVRALVKNLKNKPQNLKQQLSPMLEQPVIDYIIRNKLYRI